MTDLEDRPTLPAGAPPQDIPAEQGVLGAMMLNPAIADELSERLDVEDFYRPIHGAIFAVINAIAARGDRPDVIAVQHALDLAGDLTRIGGAPYLHTLLETPITAASGGYYADLVAEAAGRRRIIEAAAKLDQLARSPALLSDVREQAAQAAFDATTDRREVTAIESVGTLVGPVLEHVQAVADGHIPAGIPTGLTDVDRMTGGMHNGQLIIPAGRTSMGKSVITQNWIRNGVKVTGRPGILFSVEMSKDEMMQRLLSEVGDVALSSIRSGHLTAGEWERLAVAEQEIREMPLYLVDTCRTVPAVRAYCRRFRRAIGDLALVGVDYLQRLQPADRGRRDRHEVVGEMGDQLKDLAQDMNIPVVAPCQLNRGPENRPGKEANRPKLSDLRESGNLEQTADLVALLFRPDYYDKHTTRSGEADIDIAKNRNGPTDIITVQAKLYMQKFVDVPLLATPQPRPWE